MYQSLMRYLRYTFLFAFLFSNVSCKEPNSDNKLSLSTNTVSGNLSLFLHQRDTSSVYVCFELKEFAEDGTVNLIAQSDCTQVSEHPIPFSATYPPNSIRQENKYLLITTVAEDPEGKVEITTMSSPVLTRGHPSVLNIAIQPSTEPVE